MRAPAARAGQARVDSANLHIGCSGWQYKHWRGDFYPAALPVSRWLEYYAERFNTVEINNSFYRLPPPETFDAWRRRVPRHFVYAVKASRFLTHMKKLKDSEPALERLFTSVNRLRRSLGPVLYQLPPHWVVNLQRLNTFLAALPRRRLHVVEFRDPSWYCDAVYDALARHGVALCLHDMKGSETPQRRIGPFVYVRFHGPSKYSGRYQDDQLTGWAQWCAARAKEGFPVYAYFNNDAAGHAPRDAVRFRGLLNSLVPSP
jgi:uncharacterized protein YecE (DUF72 family)